MAIYDEKKTKYNLPGYDELNIEFGIEEIDDDHDGKKLVLHRIRDRIHEKLEYYSLILESMVQPDTILKDMYEAKYINDNTRENAYLLYKKIVAVLRQSDLARLYSSEERQAEFIRESYAEWKSIKEDLLKQIQKLADLWKKETDIKEDLSYFG